MSSEPPGLPESISPLELFELSKTTSVCLLDVRTADEYARCHAIGSTNVPLDLLDPKAVLGNAAEPVYLICRAGTRTDTACERLRQVDPDRRIVAVEGGMFAWRDAGLPMYRRRKKMSFRSRFLIACGVLGTLSIVLAVVVHRGLLGIIGFVAAAFVFEEILFHYSFGRNFCDEGD